MTPGRIVVLAVLAACQWPSPAISGEVPEIAAVGRIISIPVSAEDGFVRRVSSASQDGEDIQAGDFLHADDKVIMFHVVVWMEKCRQEVRHNAITERKTELMPSDCDGSDDRPQDVPGGVRVQLDGARTAPAVNPDAPPDGDAGHIAALINGLMQGDATTAYAGQGASEPETMKMPRVLVRQVDFDLASAGLTESARRLLQTLADESVRDGGRPIVQIVGSASPSGPPEYNRLLSKSRAEAVSAALEGFGLRRNDMLVSYVGEQPGAADDASGGRRVKVTVISWAQDEMPSPTVMQYFLEALYGDSLSRLAIIE